MRFMNRWEVDDAVRRYDWYETPNLLALALTVRNLRDWADENSDGWAYWPKPARACARAFVQLDNVERRRGLLDGDISGPTFKACLTPVKAFLTRQGVPHHDIIVTDVTTALF